MYLDRKYIQSMTIFTSDFARIEAQGEIDIYHAIRVHVPTRVPGVEAWFCVTLDRRRSKVAGEKVQWPALGVDSMEELKTIVLAAGGRWSERCRFGNGLQECKVLKVTYEWNKRSNIKKI